MASSISQALLAVVIFEFLVGTILWTLRTYTKFRITKDAEKWSYIWSTLTWLVGVIMTVAIILSVSYGLGRGPSVLSEDNIENTLKWSWIAVGTARFGSTFGRLTVVAFVYGVQGVTAARWRKAFLWFMGVSNFVLTTIAVFLLFFRCSPPSFIWNRSNPNGVCHIETFNQYFAFVTLSYGAASDLILACYPASIILRLKMRLRTKITLSLVLSMGVLACAFAIITVYELVRVTSSSSRYHRTSVPQDPTTVLTPVTLWAVSEMWIIFIASSVAPLWPLVKKVYDKTDGKRSSKISASSHQRWLTPRSDLDGRAISSQTKEESPYHITVQRDFDVESIEHELKDYKKSYSTTPTLQ